MNRCSKCKEHKDNDQFYTIGAWCKTCIAIDNKNRRNRIKAGDHTPKKRVHGIPTDAYTENTLSIGNPQDIKFPVKYDLISNIHRPKHHLYIDTRVYGSVVQYVYILSTYNNTTLMGIYDRIEDIAYGLADRGFRVGASESWDGYMEIDQVRNSYGALLFHSVLKIYIETEHYFLWMDQPRPLTPTEVSQITHVPMQSLNYLLENAVTPVTHNLPVP